MRTAVATLQSEQDELVRLDPTARLVLRGGPGTGKTVVALHRAAWLVYNDTRLTAGRILVIGPSDRFLRFVAAVLPTLGEARIAQTTFDRLLGPSNAAGSDERWLDVLDRFEAGIVRRARSRSGCAASPRTRWPSWPSGSCERHAALARPAADLRRAPRRPPRAGPGRGEQGGPRGVAAVDHRPGAAQAPQPRRSSRSSASTPTWSTRGWPSEGDGALADEVRARIEGVPATYGHVIVDEAQDLSLLQLRAVQRRSTGLSLVGDDAQRSRPHALGLRRGGDRARRRPGGDGHRLPDVGRDRRLAQRPRAAADSMRCTLVGIRPTGDAGARGARGGDVAEAAAELSERWPNVAAITQADIWSHKGVEYDGVVVDAAGMDAAELYLAASRAAHELVIAR